MKKETAKKILQETETGYDTIAQKFSQTRKRFWGELEFIANYTQDGSKVLDFGCGNGRLLELLAIKNPQYFGTDVSQKLLDFAQNKYQDINTEFDSESESNSDKASKRQFIKLNPSQESLAFADNFFNAVYSIAVFHHFPSRAYRQTWTQELYRVTASEGHVVVTVWNLWQSRYFKNIWQNWKNKLLGKSELDWNDCEISFTDNSGVKIQRFHHAFTKCELKKLFKKAGFTIEKCEVIAGRNIVLVGKKEKTSF